MDITVSGASGASGGIGSHVVDLAATRGHRVRAVYRGPGPRLLFRFFRTVAVPNLGRVGKDLIAMEGELTASGLDWHAVRPVKLTDGPQTRNVRAGDRLTMKAISRSDVAWHIIELAEYPAPSPLRTPVISAAGRAERSHER